MKYAITLFGAASLYGVAEAGPWAQADGDYYARSLVSRETLDGQDAWRADAYAERGFANSLTVTAKAEITRFDHPDAAITGADQEAYRVSVRKQLLQKGGWAIGAEAGVSHGATSSLVRGCQTWGIEARASLGYSGTTKKGRNWYAFGDVATIRQDGGCRRDRVELGYGADLTPNVFIEQQIWLEEGTLTADSIKVQNLIGWHGSKADLAVGYRQEEGGQFKESAYLVSVTVRG